MKLIRFVLYSILLLTVLTIAMNPTLFGVMVDMVLSK